jgi:pimeloyl-ACP methyl ester carboxylesterase
MTNPHRISVGPDDARIALARWGAESGKPVALLLHGTGFVAEVWDEVARELAQRYTVYALDRRGHGDSHKPSAGRYHFHDFADDLCRVIETLDLSDIYGIGHSAGATDLLLATKLLPDRFSRLFVMEPTIMNPHAGRPGSGLSEAATRATQGVLRRQAEFDSADAVYARYRAAPAFANWTEPSLRAYILHGFATIGEGRLRLLCTPEIESALLQPIYEAMEQVYTGDIRGNPFAWLSEIKCPVRITTAEHSSPIYKEMSSRAAALIRGASQLNFKGVGHCVGQEDPKLLLEALRAFEAATGATSNPSS